MLVASALVAPSLSAAPPPLVLQEGVERYSLKGHLGYVVDQQGSATLADIIERRQIGDHATSSSNQVVAGFRSEATVWVFFTLQLSEGAATYWWLNAAEELIDQVTVYAVAGDDTLVINRSGRAIADWMPNNVWGQHLTELDLTEHPELDLYIAVRSATALRIKPALYSELALQRQQAIDGLLIGGYAGIILMVLLISIIRASRQRSAVDGFYVVYIVGLNTSALVNLGLMYPLGWRLSLSTIHLLVIGGALLAIPALIGFMRSFIAWPHDRAREINQVLAVITAVFLAGAVSSWLISPSLAFAYANVGSALFVLAYLGSALWAAFKGYRNAILFLLAFAPFIVAVVARVLEGVGVFSGGGAILRLFFFTSLVHSIALMIAIIVREAAMRASQERLEAELTQAQRDLEYQANLTRMLAHELRTPLAVIDSYSQLATMAVEHGTQVTRQRLDKIREGVKIMAGILKRFLSEDRIISTAKPQVQALDLKLLIDQVVSISQTETNKHLLRFDTTLDQCVMSLDAELITVMLRNLIDNAIRYSPDGGNISVKLSSDSDDCIVIAVEDEGVGIPSSDLPHIFERYFRTQQVEDATGTGLGLHLVKVIAEQHGGSVSCQSALGEGTRFAVKLPNAAGN